MISYYNISRFTYLYAVAAAVALFLLYQIFINKHTKEFQFIAHINICFDINIVLIIIVIDIKRLLGILCASQTTSRKKSGHIINF